MTDRDTFPYPWQATEWQKITQLIQQETFPHAMLLVGSPETGVGAYAQYIAHALLCKNIENTQEIPCKQCYTCQLIENNGHPDLLTLDSDKPGSAIKIESIRRLIDFFSIASHYKKGRVAVIQHANLLTFSAQNSLLKILEEPPENKFFILQTDCLHSLLPTINSRCQKRQLKPPSSEESTAWLATQTNLKPTDIKEILGEYWLKRPLTALELLTTKETEDIQHFSNFQQDCSQFIQKKIALVEFIKAWKELSPQQIHEWLLEVAYQSILQALKEQKAELAQELFYFYDLQVVRYRQLNGQLNPQLVLESALLELRAKQSKGERKLEADAS